MEILRNGFVNGISDYNYGFLAFMSLKQMLQKFHILEFSNKFWISKEVLKIYQCEQQKCFGFCYFVVKSFSNKYTLLKYSLIIGCLLQGLKSKPYKKNESFFLH